MNIADLRKDYALKGLDEKEVLPDPFAQFSLWMNEALSAKLPEPTAMTLATAAPLAGGGAQPTARIVLLKGVDARGFVFFTNYSSRKGRELAANPFAGLLFHWVELEREVVVVPECTSTAASRRSTQGSPTPISPPGRCCRASAPTPRRKARCCAIAPTSRHASSKKASSSVKTCRAPSIGAATA